jgi:glycosyltransferase involved in cell wall biosynthesis
LEKVKVSVIIPTYNRDKCVIDLLNCLFRQDYNNFEVIVVDQSENLIWEKQNIINRNSGVLKYFKISERGRSLAKNYGILFSTGDILVFCDDDIIIPDNFLSTHVYTLKDPQIAAASCRLVEEGQPAIRIRKPLQTTFYGRLINKPYSTRSGYVTSLNGGNMSFKKEVLNEVGFFEEYFMGTSMVEEPDMAYRIIKSGYRLYFNASITIFHYPQSNGNIAEMKGRRADWFYYYFFNLCIFFLKYARVWNIFFLFFYSLILSLMHVLQHRLSMSDYKRMIAGFFHGMGRGWEIWKMPRHSKYYTPVRFEKKNYEPLSGES